MTTKKHAPIKNQAIETKTISPKTQMPTLKEKAHTGRLETKTNDTKNEKREELENLAQQFMNAQSGNFSSVARKLIFGIIGTIWVITYTDGKLFIPNCWLLSSLLFGLLYLFIDVTQYYFYTMNYQNETKKLSKYPLEEDPKSKFDEAMKRINHRGIIIIKCKFFALLITAILFGVGLFI